MRVRLGLVGLTLLAAAPCAGGLSAQARAAAAARSPVASGGAWAALEDSLAAIRRPALLPPAPPPVPQRGQLAQDAQSAPTAIWLRRGLILLRRYELTRADADFEEARRALEEAGKGDAGGAAAAYGLGRALLEAPELDPRPGQIITWNAVKKALGRDARSRGRGALRKALALEPASARAAARLAASALDGRAEAELKEAAAALARVDSAGAADARALVQYSRVRAALAPRDSAGAALALGAAAALARRALALDSTSSTGRAARLALAEALLRRPGGEQAGADQYLAGIEGADSAGLDPYLRDIEVYLGQHGVDSLRAAGPRAEQAALHRFWEERAALSAVSVPERLAMHYRRLAEARARYRRRSPLAVMDPNYARLRLPSKDEEFDDRGAIYVRYGEPDARAASILSERDNESWYYKPAAGEPVQAFSFLRDEHMPDYYLAGRFFCNEDYLGDRSTLDPSIGRVLAACRSGNELALLDYSAHYIAWVRAAERREHAAPAFSRDLPFFYDLATLAGENGKSTVVATLGVPLARLTPDTAHGRRTFTVHALLVVADTVAGTVERVEATHTLAADTTLAPDALLRFPLELAAPPSPRAVYRVRVDEPGSGAGAVLGGPQALPDFAAPRLALSDVLLADPSDAGTWRRGDVTLALTPTAVFPGGTLTTYYEVYHLPPGSSYETELEVTPVRHGLFGRGRSVRVRYQEQATSSGTVPELRRIRTQLPAGRYRMKVSVRAGAQVAQTSREFTVR